MPPALASTDVALRLALENVPLKVIARAIQIPSSDLREQLMDARAAGRLQEMPRDDWPVGSRRDQRVPQLGRPPVANKGELALAIGRRFNLTMTESRILLALVQSPTLDRNRDGMSSNCLGVHVSHIRKRLRPFGIAIVSVSDVGYRISERDRRKVLDLVRKHVAETP
jgi:DNA-binding response OmpR family regulator